MAAIGEILRMVLEISSPNASSQLNIFHYVVAVASDTDQAQADAINTHFVTDYIPTADGVMSVDTQFVGMKVDIVDLQGLVVRAVATYVLGQSGAVTGSVTSAAVAAYMLAKTAFPKTRGVKYLPAIAEGVVQDGALTAGGLATVILILTDYVEKVVSAGGSDLLPGVPSPSNLAFVAFNGTGFATDVPAYQRRRKPNVGS